MVNQPWILGSFLLVAGFDTALTAQLNLNGDSNYKSADGDSQTAVTENYENGSVNSDSVKLSYMMKTSLHTGMSLIVCLSQTATVPVMIKSSPAAIQQIFAAQFKLYPIYNPCRWR